MVIFVYLALIVIMEHKYYNNTNQIGYHQKFELLRSGDIWAVNKPVPKLYKTLESFKLMTLFKSQYSPITTIILYQRTSTFSVERWQSIIRRDRCCNPWGREKISAKFIWFGLVLWHINHCRLFNAKSSLYIYVKYIWFGLVEFYGISSIVGYSMPNPLYTYILNI